MEKKDYDAELEALYDAVDSLSDEFTEYLTEKTNQAALNWLRIYGMPQTPNDVWTIFSTLYKGIPANLIKDGKMTPTEAIMAPEEVKAQRQTRRHEQLTFDSLVDSIKDVGKGTEPGQYL